MDRSNVLTVSLLTILMFLVATAVAGTETKVLYTYGTVHNNHYLLYRGFMMYDHDWIDTSWLQQSDFDRIKQLGFNTVNFNFFWTSFEDSEYNAGVYNQDRLTRLENVINMARAAGLKVILSNRVTFAGNTADYRGWLNDYGPNGWEMAFTEPLLSRLCNWIRYLLVNFPQIEGLEPVNYPLHRRTADDRDLYYNVLPRLISEYRSVSDKPYFLSSVHKQAKYLVDAPAPPDNCILVIDGYGHTPFYKCTQTYDPSMFDDIINGTGGFTQPFVEAITYSERYGVPIFVDEFGTYSSCCDNEDRLQWMTDLLTWFEQHNISWTHHYGWSSQVGTLLDETTHTVAKPKTLALLAEYAS